MLPKNRYLILLFVPLLLPAQEKSEFQQIIDRLDRLEQENRSLTSEVRALRAELAVAHPNSPAPPDANTPSPPLEERVAVEERRAGRANVGEQVPLTASLADNRSTGGASMSQSIIGLTFHGPQVWGGGQVNGALYMDLWGGSSSSLNHLVRMRVATVQVDWKNQSVVVGQDKPIISPREPN